MHLVVTLPKGIRDLQVAERAAREKLWVWPLSPAYLGARPRQGLILGFGSTAADEIPKAVVHLKNVLLAEKPLAAKTIVQKLNAI